MTDRRLVLASTSPYRRELLARLQVPFDVRSPDCDETPLPDETPTELVTRLALDKAASVAREEPDALIIGSDQVAALDDRILTKPGDHATAFEQLRASSGRTVVFRTGLALVDTAADRHEAICVPYEVTFRALADEEIERYLALEAPWDAAGSIRSEGYAVTLFERMGGDDPTGLVGLPLIHLRRLLADFGLSLP